MFKKPFEYWPEFTHVIPFHLFLVFWCIVYKMHPRTLLKANYGLPHAGLHFASKYKIQESIGQNKFANTLFLDAQNFDTEKEKTLSQFIKQNRYPIIIKPDEGMTGRGMLKMKSKKDLDRALKLMKEEPYLAQAYIEGEFEYGVFFERQKNNGVITGINQKHYPTIFGDGISTIQELAEQHERYTSKWKSFLQEMDTTQILKKNQKKILSTIGSHTMGCMFTNETKHSTPLLESKLQTIFSDVPGFNYGRLDVKSLSPEDFYKGIFEIIEVNGIESQPTHMFDPKGTWRNAMKIEWKHAKSLTLIAHQQRGKEMELLPSFEILKRLYGTIKKMSIQQAKAEIIKEKNENEDKSNSPKIR